MRSILFLRFKAHGPRLSRALLRGVPPLAGELIRPIVADSRERTVYNSMVGAGTYIFRCAVPLRAQKREYWRIYKERITEYKKYT